MVQLGSVTVTMFIADDGRMIVNTTLEGSLQYVTVLGMMEMAKDDVKIATQDEED
jgi:hypothetical protein